jgi:hypothetical protein
MFTGGVVVGVCFGVYFSDYCDEYVFIIKSNTGLCVSAKVSFICKLCLLKLYL